MILFLGILVTSFTLGNSLKPLFLLTIPYSFKPRPKKNSLNYLHVTLERYLFRSSFTSHAGALIDLLTVVCMLLVLLPVFLFPFTE